MIDLTKEGDFPDGGGRQTFIHGVDGDSFEGYSLIISEIDSPADDSIRTLADGVKLVVVGELGISEFVLIVGVGGGVGV